MLRMIIPSSSTSSSVLSTCGFQNCSDTLTLPVWEIWQGSIFGLTSFAWVEYVMESIVSVEGAFCE